MDSIDSLPRRFPDRTLLCLLKYIDDLFSYKPGGGLFYTQGNNTQNNVYCKIKYVRINIYLEHVHQSKPWVSAVRSNLASMQQVYTSFQIGISPVLCLNLSLFALHFLHTSECFSSETEWIQYFVTSLQEVYGQWYLVSHMLAFGLKLTLIHALSYGHLFNKSIKNLLNFSCLPIIYNFYLLLCCHYFTELAPGSTAFTLLWFAWIYSLFWSLDLFVIHHYFNNCGSSFTCVAPCPMFLCHFQKTDFAGKCNENKGLL